jgi:hypothetical protein
MSDTAHSNDRAHKSPTVEANSYHPSPLVKIIFGLVNTIWFLGIAAVIVQLIYYPYFILTPPRLRGSLIALILFSITMIVSSLIFLWIVWHLRKLIQSIRAGSPFLHQNPGRIRKIGYATLLWAPVNRIAAFLFFKSATYQIAFPIKSTLGLPFLEMVFLGLMILVIAEVFDRGAKLQHEQDLTV